MIPFPGHLYLEKPIAPTILQHERILQNLYSAKQDFSVGYLFPFTDWYREILVRSKEAEIQTFNIQWDVKLDNNSWKSKFLSGGGIANFYAIHFVTLLEELGTDWNSRTFMSNENMLTIESSIGGAVNINISVRITSKNFFEIYCENQEGIKKEIVKMETPFGVTGKRGIQDSRISFLAEYMAHTHRGSDTNASLATEEKVQLFRKLSVQ